MMSELNTVCVDRGRCLVGVRTPCFEGISKGELIGKKKLEQTN